MPSHWGLGVMTNSGAGIDEDFGDTVDRIQFALPSASTPIGRLTLVPILACFDDGVFAGLRLVASATAAGTSTLAWNATTCAVPTTCAG